MCLHTGGLHAYDPSSNFHFKLEGCHIIVDWVIEILFRITHAVLKSRLCIQFQGRLQLSANTDPTITLMDPNSTPEIAAYHISIPCHSKPCPLIRHSVQVVCVWRWEDCQNNLLSCCFGDMLWPCVECLFYLPSWTVSHAVVILHFHEKEISLNFHLDLISMSQLHELFTLTGTSIWNFLSEWKL